MASTGDWVVIEAALNGGRDRREQPAIPYTPAEVAAEARRAVDAGASVIHLHARRPDGGWSADHDWYAETLSALRTDTPGALVGITSLRPAETPVSTLLGLLTQLAGEPATKPDLMSVNLGHIVLWERNHDRSRPLRETIHFPNDYADVVALLDRCCRFAIQPELGVMDLGFISNAVALRDDGCFPATGWFLLELDSAAYGAAPQVAPSTVANYERLSAELRRLFPDVARAVHGQGIAGFDVLRRALEDGAQIRVGFEDSVHLADGALARSNAELVEWAVATARAVGREPAPFGYASSLVRRDTPVHRDDEAIGDQAELPTTCGLV